MLGYRAVNPEYDGFLLRREIGFAQYPLQTLDADF